MNVPVARFVFPWLRRSGDRALSRAAMEVALRGVRKVLCVAEKNDAAKGIADLLSNGRMRRVRSVSGQLRSVREATQRDSPVGPPNRNESEKVIEGQKNERHALPREVLKRLWSKSLFPFPAGMGEGGYVYLPPHISLLLSCHIKRNPC
jgi:hypothetical protein